MPCLDLDVLGSAASRRRRPPAGSGPVRRTRPARRRPRSSASEHGPVRPVWLHGSSVTYAVPPRARAPGHPQRARPRRAGRPAYAWKPSPTGCPSRPVITQPTTGFGCVLPTPRAASSTARRIQAMSIGEAFFTDGPSLSRTRSGAMTTDACAGPRSDGSQRVRPERTRRSRAPPIRTFTVGPGVPPGQPAAELLDRVADYNRRLGITPTPEHASGFHSCS